MPPIANLKESVCEGNTLLQAALEYAHRGWPVFPCRRDRHPLTRWRDEATTDLIQILTWWKDLSPEAMGIPTGPTSEFWVLDIDGEASEASGKALEIQHGSLPATVEQRTGGGGRHLFFAWPTDGEMLIRNSVRKLGPGLDVRGEGGYVIVPPSLYSTI
jgi:hypothetical protein